MGSTSRPVLDPREARDQQMRCPPSLVVSLTVALAHAHALVLVVDHAAPESRSAPARPAAARSHLLAGLPALREPDRAGAAE
jgi:hypothetical protein